MSRFYPYVDGHIPVFINEFLKATSSNDSTKHKAFVKYLERNEHTLKVAKLHLRNAITGTSKDTFDSYINAFMLARNSIACTGKCSVYEFFQYKSHRKYFGP